MLMLLLMAALQAPAAPANPFAALEVLNGSWSVQIGADAKPVSLVNHCHRDDAFYTCEQVVDGKPAALLIFTVSKQAGKFDVDNVLPNGHASSDTDLFIDGDHWVYLTNDAPNHPTMKVDNTFTGRDAIHFVVSSTKDGGKTWTTTMEGENHRVK